MNDIEKDWLEYSAQTFDRGMDAESLAACRGVFYAGAMCAVGIMDRAATKDEAAMAIVKAMEEHVAEFAPDAGTCLKPPDGWRCTRPKGHDGPCAAVPIL